MYKEVTTSKYTNQCTYFIKPNIKTLLDSLNIFTTIRYYYTTS